MNDNISSVLNQVIGPVMPGSSSSHTAGPYQIAKICRSFIGELPARVVFTFGPGSSLALTYREQGSDLALVMGMLGLPLTDPRFKQAFELASSLGAEVKFEARSFPEACHPNSILVTAEMRDGSLFTAVADSTGGGGLLFRYLNGWPVKLTGDAYYLAVESGAAAPADKLAPLGKVASQSKDGRNFCLLASPRPVDGKLLAELKKSARVLYAEPVFYPVRGERLFASGAEMVAYAEKHGLSLGGAALAYEAALLGRPQAELDAELDRRLKVMEDAVALGLSDQCPTMSLLRPTAKKIMDVEAAGRLALGGPGTRAAARAMAAMQVNSGQGIVCAAPTGGSAGVVPGVLVTLLEDLRMPREKVRSALWAAGAVGLVLSTRGTFAAEVCGCQVEIGAACAMAAAAVVEAAGGTARQGADAAAIAFHNSMGLVCDLVQSTVELPCHTRNASFAAQAFVCADLILGGYENPVPLDETVDAVWSCGRMLAEELRCTSLGGIAAAPSALAMKRLR